MQQVRRQAPGNGWVLLPARNEQKRALPHVQKVYYGAVRAVEPRQPGTGPQKQGGLAREISGVRKQITAEV